MGRYDRNMMTLTPEENEGLKHKRVCVVGCGGLGGYIIEMLGRLGVGHITAIDGDVFEDSNLNRQLLSTEEVIGKSKALQASYRMKSVNSEIEVTPIVAFVTGENVEDIIKGHDVVVDALDNIDTRLILETACEEADIPLVHGAIAGWYAQITTVFPGDRSLSRLYGKQRGKGIEKELGNPSFTPALAASIEVSEVVKLLIGRGEVLRKRMLFANVLEQEYEVIEI